MPEPEFARWLADQGERQDAVGDLAREAGAWGITDALAPTSRERSAQVRAALREFAEATGAEELARFAGPDPVKVEDRRLRAKAAMDKAAQLVARHQKTRKPGWKSDQQLKRENPGPGSRTKILNVKVGASTTEGKPPQVERQVVEQGRRAANLRSGRPAGVRTARHQ